MKSKQVSIIISTYNQPLWLKKVLWSYEVQTVSDFEIIIADDGSTKETKEVIDQFINCTNLNIKHVWQEDNGFQKTKILNKAILVTTSDYLIFTDGDCLARKDFVETHLNLKEPNCCLSGGYFKLTENVSKLISKKDIVNQDCFKKKWLINSGLKKTFKMNKLTAMGIKQRVLNKFTPTKATFDGMNVSGWKNNILSVNGFDERMQYGGEDRELGERLMNMGVKFKQIRYSAICLHLFHERGYVKQEMIDKNDRIRKETRKNRKIYSSFGIKKN